MNLDNRKENWDRCLGRWIRLNKVKNFCLGDGGFWLVVFAKNLWNLMTGFCGNQGQQMIRNEFCCIFFNFNFVQD